MKLKLVIYNILFMNLVGYLKMKITKKSFKEKCSFHLYKGHRSRTNAIFYDWADYVTGKGNGHGFKYMVYANTQDATRKELFDILYNWATEKITAVPWYVRYKYAVTDDERFKVPITMSC
jgi:hypothetical protein